MFPTGAKWSIMVLGFAKYTKRSYETQDRYTPTKYRFKNISDNQSMVFLCVCNLLLFRQVWALAVDKICFWDG